MPVVCRIAFAPPPLDGSDTIIAQNAERPPGPFFLTSGDSYANSAVVFLSS